ncbi:splicing factor 3B subunit 2-like [Zophobas morio]|uniref:splicing factor 3B subunit 2-like n=1 Tax=Zophobas morio TaxID=2755281 RepID=UPI0030827B1B
MHSPSVKSVKKMTVPQLKEHLKSFGLETKGLKADLSARLLDYIEDSNSKEDEKSLEASNFSKTTQNTLQETPVDKKEKKNYNLRSDQSFSQEGTLINTGVEKPLPLANESCNESNENKVTKENAFPNPQDEKVEHEEQYLHLAKERVFIKTLEQLKNIYKVGTLVNGSNINDKIKKKLLKKKIQKIKRKEKKKEEKLRKELENNKAKEQQAIRREAHEVEIVLVDKAPEIKDPAYQEFQGIFEKFKGANVVKLDDNTMKFIDGAYQLLEKEIQDEEERKKKAERERRKEEEEETIQRLDEEGKPKLSKKKLRKETRLSVAELKNNVPRPDLVEGWDVNARDPIMLVHLKSCRNTVPVPQHWCQKRKYLQGKRGLEKSTYELPQYVADTGVAEMRAALLEKEQAQGIKAKGRERVRPKMGKIEIDYQKLHDAFFRYQTKPKMTIHGDLYYESKEYETRLTERKPGDLSDELKAALGIPLTPDGNLLPPPWLIQMQRFGPPPSYPNLRIRGLNAPIPSGAQFGYHPGGWGKPPVDQHGVPLYGDVFGTDSKRIIDTETNIDKHFFWGGLQELSEESSEEESSEEESEEELDGTRTDSGLETPSGIASIPAGLETPEHLELRKKKQIEEDMDIREQQPLYTVLPEKKNESRKGVMAPSYTYELSSSKSKTKGVEVALDPSELEDDSAIRARYEQKLKEQEAAERPEDLSDMVAAHVAQQNIKRKKKQSEKDKASKKYKDVF